MVAFIVSLVASAVMVGIVLWYARRRPPGTPVTWGEAMVAATFVFFALFHVYGIVPHQWLAWAESELNWRGDRLLAGPGTGAAWLPFTISYLTLRDIIAVLIYVVFLVVQVWLWIVWQKRGQEKPKEVPTSPYGRPLVRKV